MRKERVRPRDARTRDRRFAVGPAVEVMETRRLLANLFVRTTADSGMFSLRQAIIDANTTPAADNIVFEIPAASDAALDTPVTGFDPVTQTWTITPTIPLPTIIYPLTIDGYTQAQSPVYFKYSGSPNPIPITSAPNTFPILNGDTSAAKDGNNARVRLIIDGSQIDRVIYPIPEGFTLSASNGMVRGLAIEGFGVGVDISNPSAVGDLVQGNFIGGSIRYLVDPSTGLPPTFGPTQIFAGQGNDQQGVIVNSTNATVGGTATQEANVITLNGAQGVWIKPGAHGNQVLGNQIGVAGPSTASGEYYAAGNNAEGILIDSASSNAIGGATRGAGNIISDNLGDGIHIKGVVSVRNRIEGNDVGTSPGGGHVFGSLDPGNGGDGVLIEDSSSTQVGGSGVLLRNVISSNSGAGVRITGATATSNDVLGNYIGLQADGISALGNVLEGVVLSAPSNTIGPGNVISANLRGVLITAPFATNELIEGNFIGTTADGEGDVGNAEEGIRIETANNRVIGDGKGSQIVSGNNQGIVITGSAATGNSVVGTFVGTDEKGMLDLGNSLEGVRIEGAPANTIGGGTAATRNLISANHWGVVLTYAGATANAIQGNFIGTDVGGTQPLGNGNELDGVWITGGATNNLVGGSVAAQGNAIAFNVRDGVRVDTAGSVGNSVLSNRIFSNGELGINLVGPIDAPNGVTQNDLGDSDTGPNDLQNFPILSNVQSAEAGAIISGSLNSTPDTTFTVQFFSNPSLNPSGFGEGAVYLGSTTLQTDSTGNRRFSATVPTLIPAGWSVTSTATSASGDTSEFSSGIQEILGSVQFTAAALTVSEGVGQALVQVTRTGGSGGYFTVDYATQDGTAVSANTGSTITAPNYQSTSGTLTFNPGEDSKTISVTIFDNGVSEPARTFFVSLGNPTGAAALGTPTTETVSILDVDQPGTIRFGATEYSVNEGAGTAKITVTRGDGNAGTVSIDYATSDATPGALVDYVPTSGTLTFDPGETSKTIAIPILADHKYEPDQEVRLTLSNPIGGASLGLPNTALLTIHDSDAPMHGNFQFGATAFATKGGVGSTTITVTRVGGADGQASVNYATVFAHSIPGLDYTAVAGTLVFQDQQTTASFAVPILDPLGIVGDRTIGLALSQPTGGATLGSPSVAELTILDTVGPTVSNIDFFTSGGGGIKGLTLVLSEPVDPSTAINLVNYGYSVRASGRDHKFGTRDDVLVPIRAAVYDPIARMVTLTLRKGLKSSMPFRVTINQSTSVAGAGVGVSDLAGNLLDGANNGSPGSPFFVVLGGKSGSATIQQKGRFAMPEAGTGHPKGSVARGLSKAHRPHLHARA